MFKTQRQKSEGQQQNVPKREEREQSSPSQRQAWRSANKLRAGILRQGGGMSHMLSIRRLCFDQSRVCAKMIWVIAIWEPDYKLSILSSPPYCCFFSFLSFCSSLGMSSVLFVRKSPLRRQTQASPTGDAPFPLNTHSGAINIRPALWDQAGTTALRQTPRHKHLTVQLKTWSQKHRTFLALES